MVRLDRADLQRLLEQFGAAFANASGDRLSSRDFYERYRAGEFDTPLGMAWATYWEAFLRRDPVRVVEGALPPVAV